MAQLRAEFPKLRLHGTASSLSDRFLRVLSPADRIVFVSHVNPDPDSLGSMLGLSLLVNQTLGKPTVLTCDGPVKRAENRLLIDLVNPHWVPLAECQPQPGDAVVMVDSQPGTGRHSLSPWGAPRCVIDHHVTPGDNAGVAFTDIRPDLGAACSIATEYLLEQKIRIPSRVATALLYGIETEVGGYPREATPADDVAMAELFPIACHETLARIRNAPLPTTYFQGLSRAMQNTVSLNRAAFAWVDPLTEVEQAAEISEWLLRCEQFDWVICAGVLGEQLILSVRSALPKANAGQLLREVVGLLGSAGGHHRRAGGCIRLTSNDIRVALRAELQERFRRTLNLGDGEFQPLL
jgi:nanoRNase/pAp phosphatase (c-di-AMP/oligoRNAs hydrolase)